jgi:hypothetical protein
MQMIEWLERAADSLGLVVERDYEVVLPGHPKTHVAARVLNVGGRMGMLIFERYEDAKHLADQLVGAGYGYTVLDQPRPNEAFDLESYREMAADWGWSGPIDSKPNWFNSFGNKDDASH